MTRPRLLLALGVGAFVLMLIVTLPAQVVLGQLGKLGIEATGVSGSVWNGQAAMIRIRQAPLGQLRWDLHVLELLTGRASATVALRQAEAFVEGDVSAALGGRITLSDVSASWPLDGLAAAGMPAGWKGMANARLAEVVVEKGLPVAVTGTIDLMNVVGPANRPANIGSYRATFPAAAANADDGIGADLKDLDGPIALTATLRVQRDRSYLIDGQIATRPEAPSQVVSALQYLGEADASGRRPFSLSGTF
jgi:general secretion pathway protein N